MKPPIKKFNFQLKGLSEDGQYFGYEDYRLDQPERGLFYVGIGDRRRVRLAERYHNRGHTNISLVHGVLRRIVKTFTTVEEMNLWEIQRIFEVRLAGATLVNKADGGEGTRGLMPCRNLVTGETRVFRVDEIPEGWAHSSTNMVPCRNLATGETTNFLKDQIPEGWETTASGSLLVKNKITGEIKNIRGSDMPAGWSGVNLGKATYKNTQTGETAMYDAGKVPEGWVHIFTGLVSCRNIDTGETGAFPADAIPPGWAGVTKGMIACKNPITGETGSFYKKDVPDGWVGMNAGNKKTNSVESKIIELARTNPLLTKKDLIEYCAQQGINKSTAGVYVRRLGLGADKVI